MWGWEVWDSTQPGQSAAGGVRGESEQAGLTPKPSRAVSETPDTAREALSLLRGKLWSHRLKEFRNH